MELLHHRITLREDDGASVCSRCGLLDPGDGDLCVPVELKDAESDSLNESSDKKAA